MCIFRKICDKECKRAVESCIAKEFADSLNIPFIETSAKENTV